MKIKVSRKERKAMDTLKKFKKTMKELKEFNEMMELVRKYPIKPWSHRPKPPEWGCRVSA